MVYVDVTDACKSARNTGIERMTRRIHATLAERTSTTPLCWNRISNGYHRLAARELANLRDPFARDDAPRTQPERHGAGKLGDVRRLLSSRAFDPCTELATDDVFLMPDFFNDGRLRLLPKLPRRKVAIFHDAAALQLPFISANARERFREYLDSLGRFDLVICVSRGSERELREHWRARNVAGTATCVESWPVEICEVAPTISTPRRVLTVGSLEPRKNHLTLLRAAQELWDAGTAFELQLIGQSAAWGQRHVVPKIDELRRGGYAIEWLRHVNDVVLHRAYSECRFTVYPSLREGFGLPIYESLRHGKPCICGSNDALGEATEGGGCLKLADQRDASAMAAAIGWLLDDSGLYAELAEAARRRTFRSWTDYGDALMRHLGHSSKIEMILPRG